MSLPLKQLLDALPDALYSGPHAALETAVTRIAYDSQKVETGNVFVAIRGTKVNGNDFIPSAVENGALAVISERAPSSAQEKDIPWIHVSDSNAALASVSSAFFDHPTQKLKIAGITGTNGKTTIAYLVRHLCESSQKRCGQIGTVEIYNGVQSRPATHTTPLSLELQEIFADIRDHSCRAVAMEVSSHALHQNRIHGVPFSAAVFTNLTQDHLDYHESMDAYFESKARLFELTRANQGWLIINADDTWGRKLIQRHLNYDKLLTFGMGINADFRASAPRWNMSGTTFQLDAVGRQFLVRLPLIGKFNLYNALAALATAKCLGVNVREGVRHLAEVPQVPGRLESVADRIPFRIFVDYAHTPDALENVLSTLKDLEPARLITIAGCGGDRDPYKRPLMAAACEKWSDVTILTSDNPRNENPEDILKDMARGMRTNRYTIIADRREAIRLAVSEAKPNDIILIAGKGHEDYMEFENKRRVSFDDRKEAIFALKDYEYII